MSHKKTADELQAEEDARLAAEEAALEPALSENEQEIQSLKDQVVRVHADMDNLRRRSEREVDSARKYGSERLLRDLIPVVDGLVSGIEAAGAEDLHVAGMKLTLDLLEKTLQNHGVTVINPIQGEAFNPEKHQAMTMQPASEAVPANCVMQVLQKGFELHGRVIRAAMVIVAQ